ncbi:MAG TPA: HEAT repeat domain-containing protein [Pirellulaceae bacterium]
MSRVLPRYASATLIRLCTQGSAETRRAAVLALGMSGGREAMDPLGKALRDRDRAVRILAFDLLPEVWLRSEGPLARGEALRLRYLFSCGCYREAIAEATRLLKQHPTYDEAQFQRGLARFRESRFRQAESDFREVLERTPYHFPAAIQWGQSRLRCGNHRAALRMFLRALEICPGLESVRLQARQLLREM